jgi:hypothetical protein
MGQHVSCQPPTMRATATAGAPLNLCADDIDDLIRQAGDVLVAEVDGDAGLLLLQFAGRGLGGGALAEVAAGVLEGGFGEGHDLVVGDGRGRVVAHCGR